MKKGDIVQLKSGGPPMIISLMEGTTAYCKWLDENKLVGDYFETITLLKLI